MLQSDSGGKPRLELRWIDKDRRISLEPRILIEDATLSYPALKKARRNSVDLNENKLIFGDNLLGLKALEQDFTGRVKCCFIDPPYNTGSAFTHYDDGLEHSIWLGLMRDRLEIIRRLLSDDGSLWITIDDHEAHYLKVMCDEIFGRRNFVANVVWQKKYSVANDHKTIAPMHDHLLVYRKSELWQRNRLDRRIEQDRQYRLVDDGGIFRADNYTCNKTAEERPNLYYPIVQPATGENIWPKKTAVWRYSPETHQENVRRNLVYWGKDGTGRVPAFKRYRKSLKNAGRVIPGTWWTFEDASHTDAARKEVRAVLGTSSLADDFVTPKPEGLIKRVLSIATNPGDLVLDSFAGSGTTGAVAHKMGRRWIMIELGKHCHTHIIPRMQKVIDGADSGGITTSVNWRGGGGFRYYALAPSLLEVDKYGRSVIAKSYDPEMLIRAVCKLQNFQYAPNKDVYWQHGRSTERDFIYVIPENLNAARIAQIARDVGTKRSLLVMCRAFGRTETSPRNLTLKKIPDSFLKKYVWGRSNYSLNISTGPSL